MTSASETTPAEQDFWRRLTAEWLPSYCNDPKRRYSIEGFNRGNAVVGDIDARDFLRAIDHSVVTIGEGGRIRMPQSKTHEVIFWEHSVNIVPRPITLWLEPVITIAAIARLHLDYGWPVDCLGMQSADNAFDLMGFKPGDLTNEYIAGEVKPTIKQLDALIANLNRCCASGDHDDCLTTTRRNAHKKWMALARCRAPLFWAIGPGGEGRVFEVAYPGGLPAKLRRVDDTALKFTVAEVE